MNNELNSGSHNIQVGQIWTDSRMERLIKIYSTDGEKHYQIRYSSLNFDGTIQSEQYGGDSVENFLRQYRPLEMSLEEMDSLGEKILSGEIKFDFAPVEQEAEQHENQSAVMTTDTKKNLQAKVAQLKQTEAGVQKMRDCLN